SGTIPVSHMSVPLGCTISWPTIEQQPATSNLNGGSHSFSSGKSVTAPRSKTYNLTLLTGPGFFACACTRSTGLLGVKKKMAKQATPTSAAVRYRSNRDVLIIVDVLPGLSPVR